MSDIGNDFKAIRRERQDRRAANRENSALILQAHGIDFESKADGTHLIIKSKSDTIHFYPGTGLWMLQGDNQRNRGVHGLIKALRIGSL
jgi:hypothetical protein